MSEPKYKEWVLRVLRDRCATCSHWGGDREKIMSDFEENPKSIDLEDGWAGDGDCGKQYLWANIEIDGNASVSLNVDGSFGCVLHKVIVIPYE